MSSVAVVILNWNGLSFLERFLPLVIRHSSGAKIVVADNNSSDGSVSYVRSNFPEVSLIELDGNYGFAGGYNRALGRVEADYFVLLNSDIEVTPGWLDPLIGLMESNSRIAACQPKILSYDRRTQFEYAGAAGGFIDRYGYPFCRGRLFQTLEEDRGQYDQVTEIFWATGACMAVRADLFLKLGGFDERFFAHMEEIDFCWRAKNHGYTVFFTPESTVFHIGGGTLPKSSARKTYLNIRNNNMMIFKNWTRHGLWRRLLYRLLLDGVAAVKFLIDGGWANLWAVVRAHYAFFGQIPVLLKERKREPRYRVSMMYNGNVVYDYFIRRKKTFSELNHQKFTKN
ncbi:MAG: glycosyltransferase family 2 protein [Bacteroidales bacterium]